MRFLCRFLLLNLMMTTLKAGTFPESNGESLRGITAFDARIFYGFEEPVKNLSSDLIQESFHLALRRDGVVVNEAALNYLICNLNINIETELVTYLIRLEFWDYKAGDELNVLLWTDSVMGTLGSGGYTIDWVAQKCADEFAKEWLKQNPK